MSAEHSPWESTMVHSLWTSSCVLDWLGVEEVLYCLPLPLVQRFRFFTCFPFAIFQYLNLFKLSWSLYSVYIPFLWSDLAISFQSETTHRSFAFIPTMTLHFFIFLISQPERETMGGGEWGESLFLSRLISETEWETLYADSDKRDSSRFILATTNPILLRHWSIPNYWFIDFLWFVGTGRQLSLTCKRNHGAKEIQGSLWVDERLEIIENLREIGLFQAQKLNKQ